MVTVNIDIRNIASQTYSGDRVTFRSPVVREAPGGGLVSTAEEIVTLLDGQGSVYLTPGPVIVTFQCRGISDNSPKRGIVPDSGTVELSQVITGNLTFTPEVVGAAQAARDDAQDAAGQAKDYRDAAADSADAAAASAGLAASSLSGAQDLASDVSDDVAQAISSRDQAAQSATAASTSASQAATSRDQAAQSATDAAAALGTKADKVHTHTTVQVTGLDTALSGKADTTTLDGRIPSGLALRLDTTVGTRIFAGDTMIYGDTGWRNVSDSLMNGWTGTVWFRRKGDLIVYRFSAVRGDSATANQMLPGFPGSAAITSGTVSIPYLAKVIDLNVSWSVNGATISSAHRGLLSGELSYHTQSAWPTTLPGLPV